jgi:NAD(P)H dehydrogenase (quinone)
MTSVVIAYHSKEGHTKTLAQEVAKGVESVGARAQLVSVTEEIDWDVFNKADAIILGSPTYMGNVTGQFKMFMDASGDAWFNQKWKNKLAAGFTNSHSASGDKLTVLIQMTIFAAQHGMLWVGQAEKREGSGPEHVNRLGSYLGAMAQCDPFLGTVLPPEGDRRTAFLLGARVAGLAKK